MLGPLLSSNYYTEISLVHSSLFISSCLNMLQSTVLLVVSWLTSGVLSTQVPIIGQYTVHCMYSYTCCILVNQWSPLNSSSCYRSVHCTLYRSTCCILVYQWSPLNSSSYYRSVHCTLYTVQVYLLYPGLPVESSQLKFLL